MDLARCSRRHGYHATTRLLGFLHDGGDHDNDTTAWLDVYSVRYDVAITKPPRGYSTSHGHVAVTKPPRGPLKPARCIRGYQATAWLLLEIAVEEVTTQAVQVAVTKPPRGHLIVKVRWMA